MKIRVYLPIGSISHGTMRMEDTIPAMVDTLRDLARTMQRTAGHKKQGGRLLGTCRKYDRAQLREGYFDSENAQFDHEELFDLLNSHCPPYASFGAHEGDGSDYGVWPCHEQIEEERRSLELPDFQTVGKRYRGLSCNVTDHGNVSIIEHDGRGGEHTLWGIV